MQSNGWSVGLWLPGHVVFGTCVIVVNLIIVLRFSNYTGWGELAVYLMILWFPTLMLIESSAGPTAITDLYWMFDALFMQGLVWVQMIAASLIVAMIDIAYLNYERLTSPSDFEIKNEVKEYNHMKLRKKKD